MEFAIIGAVALLTSGLTLFSGFGLGTLLLPAFLLFFPPDVAVAMTAVVHLANNLFKLALLGRFADRGIVLRFGLPAIVAALAGAAVLVAVSGLEPLWRYTLGGRELVVLPVKLVMGALIVAFAILEMLPETRAFEIAPRYLPLGGLLSGFFGGLSGHQGALRTAFLIRAGLGKEAFIATGVVIACLIDLTRISVYAGHFALDGLGENLGLIVAATLCAFAGAFAGARLVRKVTLRQIHVLVAALLLLVGAGLITGLL